MTTECRQLNYERRIVVHGPSLPKVQAFVTHVYNTYKQNENEGKIIIYENSEGYWNETKVKKPRKMESVIFKEDFI